MFLSSFQKSPYVMKENLDSENNLLSQTDSTFMYVCFTNDMLQMHYYLTLIVKTCLQIWTVQIKGPLKIDFFNFTKIDWFFLSHLFEQKWWNWIFSLRRRRLQREKFFRRRRNYFSIWSKKFLLFNFTLCALSHLNRKFVRNH